MFFAQTIYKCIHKLVNELHICVLAYISFCDSALIIAYTCTFFRWTNAIQYTYLCVYPNLMECVG